MISEQGQLVQDTSNDLFEVANNGTEYYVSTTGNDNFGGKTSNRPMKTLAALLDAYDLDAGDTVHIASGTYTMLRNNRLTAQDSGVTIRGPLNASAIFQQSYETSQIGSTAVGFELVNADNITIDSISVTGAYSAIYAANSSDSDDLTVRNSRLYGNYNAGIEVGVLNDRLLATNNVMFGVPGGTFLDNQSFGITTDIGQFGSGNDHQIRFNEIYDHGNFGIFVRGARSVVSDNDVHGNLTGIYSFFSGNEVDRVVVSNNKIHDNTSIGLVINGVGLVTNNEVYGHVATNGFGIDSNVDTKGNIVRNNYNGMRVASVASPRRIASMGTRT